MTGRRLPILLVVLAAMAIPAGVLHAACAGRSCDHGSIAAARVPFCPLPPALKEDLSSGYREGRSPDVLGVAGSTPIVTNAPGSRVPWPALDTVTDSRVPIVFAGEGVSEGTSLPDGLTLDRIAPTVAGIIGFERPFPGVRSGIEVNGIASGERPALVLLVAWKPVGSAELEDHPDAWPFLASLLEDGAGTLEGDAGSLPLDPAATLGTIGTGGLPAQHGITGSFVRNDEGEVVPAFGAGSPVPVIATLADDLDEATGQRAIVALVASDELDRALIGGEWYARHDVDDVVVAGAAAAVTAARSVLADGIGVDDVPDVLGVVLSGGVQRLDGRTAAIVRAARRATDDSVLVVVAGTGTWERSRLAVFDTQLVDAVEAAVPGDAPAVAASVAGGIFLDREALTAAHVTGQVAVDAMLGVTDSEGRAMVADAFQGFAVSFARYC